MRTIKISNTQLNGHIDSINGALIGLSKCMETTYNYDDYAKAMSKLTTRLKDFAKVLGINDEKHFASYCVSALEIRTMRFSKAEVKVLSGSAFRKWFKEGLMRDRLGITFESVAEPKKATVKKTVNAKEYAAFKAWQANHK